MKILATGFYRNVFTIGFLALIFFAIVVPTAQIVLNPPRKERFRLSEAEIATLKGKAEKGDAAAARRIYEHFVYFEKHYTNAHQWLERAAVLGDTNAMSFMKSVYDSAGIEGYRSFIGRTNESLEAVFFRSIPAETNGID